MPVFTTTVALTPGPLAGPLVSFGREGGGSTITQQLAKNLFKTRRKTNTGLLNPDSVYPESYLQVERVADGP